MSASDSDYNPSDNDYDDQYTQGILGTVTDEEYATEEEGGTFFDEEVDPLSLLEGMENSERQPFEVIAHRHRRRRSRRVADLKRASLAEDEDDDEDEEMQDQDEETETDDDQPGAAKNPPSGPPLNGDDEEDEDGYRKEKWDDALAEKMGMQPIVNRKKARNREKWRRRRASTGSRRRDKVPEEASKKLGEANMLYAMQKHHEAIALLMEVIRLAPNLPDPYQTLGLLHEAIGNSKKALDFFMIAAHLIPRETPLWKRLAVMSTDHQLVRQAVYCYSQVLKREREDVDARFDRALLYAELEDHKKAIEGFEQVLKARPGHPEAARALARVCYRIGQHERARDVLQLFIDEHPEAADLTHANILAELYAEERNWVGVLSTVDKASAIFCDPGEDVPVDLQVKAGIALAHMNRVDAAMDRLEVLLQQPVEAFIDLYVDVAAHFELLRKFELAEQFLRPCAVAMHDLIIWRRLADVCRHLSGAGAAAEVYEEFLENITPTHEGYIDAMVSLAESYRDVGDDEAAAVALARLEDSLQEFEQGGIIMDDIHAAEEHVLRRAAIMMACGKKEMFLDVALPALSNTLRTLSREAEAMGNMDPAARRRLRYVGRGGKGHNTKTTTVTDDAALNEGGIFVGYVSDKRRRKTARERNASQQLLSQKDDDQVEDGATTAGEDDQEILPLPTQTQGGPGPESDAEDDFLEPGAPILPGLLKEERPFMLLVDAVRALLDDYRPSEARELTQATIDICARRFTDRSRRDVLRMLLFEADLVEREFSSALGSLKAACNRWPRCPTIWNALSRQLLEAGGTRQAAKFLAPLRQKHPTAVPVALALGHCHLVNWQYADALGEYFQAHRIAPKEPLVLLCIAVALVNRAATRRVNDQRHSMVLQAFAYLQDYAKERCDDKESAYNIARAAHQLGLLHIATPIYKRVLQGGADDGQVAAGFDIRREAAHNLALIYQGSGSMELAKEVLRKYATV